MLKLTIQIKMPGCADGTYRIRAKGCIAAVLCWANSRGELPDWTPFAYAPIAADDTGRFIFGGHRGHLRSGKTFTHDSNRHLSTSDTVRHIILCHVPLLQHNPPWSAEKDAP